MTDTIRPLPQLPEPGIPETVLERGARVLQFILATSCTATLTDLDLERADAAAVYAVSARDPYAVTLQRLSEARHVIALALKYRRSILPAREQGTPAPVHELPNLGPMAPLQPAPAGLPPAPVRRVPEIAF